VEVERLNPRRAQGAGRRENRVDHLRPHAEPLQARRRRAPQEVMQPPWRQCRARWLGGQI
jgi:hypothetical protein